MKCIKCGFESPDDSNFCNNCGYKLRNDDINQNNIALKNNTSDINSIKKCPRCGYLNDSNSITCKNCETMLSDNDIIINKPEISKKKFVLYFVLYSVLYILGLFFIAALGAFTQKSLLVILMLIALILLAVGIEPLVIATIKTKTKNQTYLKTGLFWLDAVLICMFLIFFLFVRDSFWFCFVAILLRLISWFITRKLMINEKIKINKKLIIVGAICFCLTFLLYNFTCTTKLNKQLFIWFGNTEFSSKELYIELIDEYNSSSANNVTYLHKLTQDEINDIDELNLLNEVNLTQKDLNLLSNLRSLYISEKVHIDKDIDFSNNKKLNEVSINSQGIKKVKLSNSIVDFSCKYILDELDVSNINGYDDYSFSVRAKKIIGSDFDTFYDLSTENYSEIYFKELLFDDKLLGTKNSFLCFDNFSDGLLIKGGTLISDLKTNNLKIVVKEKLFSNGERIKESNETLDDSDLIYIYDLNDNLLFEGEVNLDYA